MKRRNFIYNSSILAAGTGFLHLPSFSANRANEKIILAIVGCNSRGAEHARMIPTIPNAEIGYICDVDELVLQKTIAQIEKLTGKKPKGYKDVRKLLEEKDLDAIIIATPDHWHAPAALMALKAGKHVYIEKPCSHNPAEGEMLVLAAEKYKKFVQVGSQRRSFPAVMDAIKRLHEGVIGDVYYAKGWYARRRASIGEAKIISPPATLDYELWQGPAPRKPYRSNLIHYNWHWFWHWGTGEALNNGTHEFDVMRWGLNVKAPIQVVSAGSTLQYSDSWETPDTQTITHLFPGNKMISWEGHSTSDFKNEGSGRGVVFYGSKGNMIIPGGDDYKIVDIKNKLIEEVKSKLGEVDATNPIGMGASLDRTHLVNFMDTLRGNAKLTAPISEGHLSNLLPQLGNIALRTGKTLKTDPLTGRIDDKEAMKLWSRAYEKGWEMKL
ncbi:MAG: Gfo/Idh/MocA family oxidoreductase [Gemmatimonadaceae bacterium]|nr:Gfo/Idh/MocA family oxidoreductase [Chitinophagaceae bacterium]